MSNLALLPLVRIAYGCSPTSDFVVAFSWQTWAGAPIDLTGIAFSASISQGTWTSGQIAGSVSGLSNSLLTFMVPAISKSGWPISGVGVFSATATAMEGTADVVAPSLVALGASAELVVTPAPGRRQTASAPDFLTFASLQSPSVVAAIEAIISAYLTGLPTAPTGVGQLYINDASGDGPVSVSLTGGAGGGSGGGGGGGSGITTGVHIGTDINIGSSEL